MTTMNNEDPADPSVHEPLISLEDIRGAVARGWCHPANEHKAMDPPLALAIADEVHAALSAAQQPALYTADQMREAIAAERERSHELLQAADHIRAGLDAELAVLLAALAELVVLENMKDHLAELHEMGHGTDYSNYRKRLPLAWATARTILANCLSGG